MKITLMYLGKEKGEWTKEIEVDMDSLLTVRFVLSDEQHIDISGRPDAETGGLSLMGKGLLSIHPGAGNSVAVTAGWKRQRQENNGRTRD